ncbi:MAG TPA: flagellar hook capping FlgD N-terminal domain-containing protein [Rhodocyclaceae bacterium]|nr:flagellar hook capping FlgD N-terminal domain-containing protein [Rhodocyclaceae bacterium]
MAVEAIGGITSSTAAATAAPTSTLGQADLLKIMLTELQFQDPLKPVDNTEFIAQLAQFTTLEQTKQLNDSIDTLLSMQAGTQSIGLLGRDVQVTLPQGGTVVGTVTSFTFVDGQPNLTIKDSTGALTTGVGLSNVTLVR